MHDPPSSTSFAGPPEDDEEATVMLSRPIEAMLPPRADTKAPDPAPTPAPTPAPAPLRSEPKPRSAALLPPRSPWSSLSPNYFEPVSATQVALGNRLLSLLPALNQSSSPIKTLEKALQECANQGPYQLGLYNLCVHQPPFNIPDFGHALLSRFELPAQAEFGLLVADLTLAEGLLRTLLEETPDQQPPRLSPVSPRDFGLLTYVLLRLLDQLVTHHGAPPVIISTQPPGREEIASQWQEGEGVVELVFLCTSPHHAGFVRLFVPATLITAFEHYATHSHATQGIMSSLEQSALHTARLPLHVDVARTKLSRFELVDLCPGDVLIPESHVFNMPELSNSAQAITPALLSARAEPNPYFKGELSVDPEEGYVWTCSSASCFITRTTPINPDDIASQQESHPMTHASQQEQTSDLLDDANLVLHARLGQASLTLRELTTMQPGQIIALGVPMGHPIELVVGEQVVGTGELVNIEGHLGVKVLTRR